MTDEITPTSSPLSPSARALFNAFNSPMLLMDADWKIIAANQAACRLYGWDEATLCKKSSDDLFALPAHLLPYKRQQFAINPHASVPSRHHASEGRLLDVRISLGFLSLEGTQYRCVSVTDISDLMAAESERLELSLRWQNTISASQLGTWEWNVQTGELLVNERWANIVGYKLEELRPLSIDTWVRFAHPDDLQDSNKRLSDVFEKRSDLYQMEARMLHRDGHWVWVLDRGSVVNWTEDGKPLWMAGTHYDITAQKLAQDEARANQELLASYGRELPGMLFLLRFGADGSQSMPYASTGIQALFGVTAQQVATGIEPLFQFIHPDDLKTALEQTAASVKNKTNLNLELRAQLPNQPEKWLLVKATPFTQPSGDVDVYGYAADISELKDLGHKKAHVEASFNTVLDSMQEAVLMVDRQWRYTFINKAAEQLRGVDRQTLIGKVVKEVVPALVGTEDFGVLQMVMETRHPILQRGQVLNVDGESRWFEWSIQPALDGIMVLARDIDDQVTSQQKIEHSEKRYQLSAANSPDVILMIDLDKDQVTFANRPVLLGFPSAEVGMPTVMAGLFNSSDGAAFLDAFSNIQADKQIDREVEATDANGKLVWLRLRLTMLNISQVLLTVTDITAQHMAQAALIDHQTRYQTVFGTIHDAVGISNLADERFVEVNDAFCDICALPREKILGHNTVELGLWKDPEVRNEFVRRLRAEGTVRDMEVEFQNAKGTPGWILISGHVISIGSVPHAIITGHDITSRKADEWAIAESEQRFRDLFEGSQEGILYLDQNENMLIANPAFSNMVSYNLEELATQPCSMIQVEDDPRLQEMMSQLESEGRARGETWLRRKDGNLLPVDMSVTQVTSMDGQQTTSVIVRDISALSKARDDLQRIFDVVPIMLAVADSSTGIFLHANDAWNVSLGYTPQEITSQPFFNFIHPDDIGQTRQAISALMEGKKLTHFINRYKAKDGQWHWLEWESAATPDRKLMYSSARDITERLRQEEELRLAEQRSRQTLDTIPGLIWSAKPDGEIDYLNQGWLNYTGFRLEQASGHGWEQALHPEDILRVRGEWESAFKKKEPYTSIERLRAKDGTYRWYMARAMPFFDENGMLLKWFGLNTDIDEQKQAEDQLAASNDLLEDHVRQRTLQLEQSNAALQKALATKEQFLAAVSHELRTPLTGVLGLSQVLQLPTLGPLTEKQREAAINIEQNGQRLLSTINDMILFSQLQSGDLKPQPRKVAVGSLCQMAIHGASGAAKKRNINLALGGNASELTVLTDEKLVLSALGSLLSNAIKFCPEGGNAGLDAVLDEQAGMLRLEVWDKGIGIAEKSLPKLFLPFVQLDARLSRAYEGTGLGLAIVKLTMLLLGGDATVASTLGKGSRFTLTLPIDIPKP